MARCHLKDLKNHLCFQSTSGVTSIGARGQSAPPPLTAKKLSKMGEKRGKIGKREEKSGKKSRKRGKIGKKRPKSGRF